MSAPILDGKLVELPDQNQCLLATMANTPIMENPCVRLFGKGPEGATCKSCALLFCPGGTSKRYNKCKLRQVTHGPGSDHKVRWPACAKYDPTKTINREVNL